MGRPASTDHRRFAMWEDVTVLLCALGFLVTVGLVTIELPRVISPGLTRDH